MIKDRPPHADLFENLLSNEVQTRTIQVSPGVVNQITLFPGGSGWSDVIINEKEEHKVADWSWLTSNKK